jgi:hypothetical protein
MYRGGVARKRRNKRPNRQGIGFHVTSQRILDRERGAMTFVGDPTVVSSGKRR